MCGIAGILYYDGRRPDPDELQAYTSSLRHRGPDSGGRYVEGAVGLGHRRLIIIDLESGSQPLANEDGTVRVTYNGEIYNFRELRRELEEAGHVFLSRSDTEVLVHGWEEWESGMLKRLRGMFAFALWDSKANSLFLARDRVGIKPLYYYLGDGFLAFASEIQAFRRMKEVELSIDPAALDMYLHFQYIPAPYTAYRNLFKLPPAHFMEVSTKGHGRGPERYWRLRFVPGTDSREEEWLERIDSALRESVESHLVSDVPFGAFLSGGIDSSTVVAYMSSILDAPVKTFSIGFDEPGYDETSYARYVAGMFGTEHHEMIVKPDMVGILPELVKHYGEPFADSSAIPTYYVSKLAAEKVKMVLSGDGGDELFAGYSSYGSILWAHRKARGLLRSSKHRVGNVLRAAGLRPRLPDPVDGWYEWTRFFDEEQRKALWLPDQRVLPEGTRRWYDDQIRESSDDELCRFQDFDFRNYLSSDILFKVDIASMYHSLEVRVPLLDHRFAELAASVPQELKLHPGGAAAGRGGKAGPSEGKYLLKRNAERFFPRDFVYRRKGGFSVPMASWLAGPLEGMVQERLLSPGGALGDWFDMRRVTELVEEHRRGLDHADRIWSLLVLVEWLEQERGKAA